MKKLLSTLLVAVMLLSVVSVNVSADGYYIQERFVSMESFAQNFEAGSTANATYIEDSGMLYGYNDARALQGLYATDEDTGLFKNELNTWLSYDMEVSVALDVDIDEQRDFSIVYCNDNPRNAGTTDSRIFMAFGYDCTGRQFFFHNGLGYEGDETTDFMPSVAAEINDDGNTFYKFGMSITRGRIRCYFEDKLIFDFVDTADEYMIAKDINSPFLAWNTNNFFQIDAIDIASPGYIYPLSDAADTTAPNGGDNNQGGNQGGNETPVTSQKIEIVTKVVTNEAGETEVVTETQIVNVPVTPDTNKNGSSVSTSTTTGDAAFVVVAVMVAALGCALIVKKVNVK